MIIEADRDRLQEDRKERLQTFPANGAVHDLYQARYTRFQHLEVSGQCRATFPDTNICLASLKSESPSGHVSINLLHTLKAIHVLVENRLEFLDLFVHDFVPRSRRA